MKLEKSIIILWCTAISALIYLGFLLNDDFTLRAILKPLPVIFLIVYLMQQSVYNPYLFLALIFSIIGDIALVFPSLIITGIIAFFAAQCSYATFFFRYKPKLINKYLILPFFIFLSVFIISFWSHLGHLRLYVIGYALSLSTMVFLALQIKNVSLIRVGAMLFLISDLLVGLQLFVISQNTYVEIISMALYYLAQTALICGCIKKLDLH